MSWITLDEAKENLRIWLEAERAVATSQSYKIGSRQLTRADLAEIANRITYWRNEIAKLETGRTGARVFRAVPHDF